MHLLKYLIFFKCFFLEFLCLFDLFLFIQMFLWYIKNIVAYIHTSNIFNIYLTYYL
jgi:hypothetical protein